MAVNTTRTTAKSKKTAASKSGSKKTLVIVESPSKAKTIGNFLGRNTYTVVASVGHVRDLPKSRMGVLVDNDFEPEYINIRGKGDVIKMLKKEAKEAKRILLATDPDREGEAISWHLAYLLGIDPTDNCRVTFNEITKDAVKKAIKEPRSIDLKLVDAQQARRVLDRLVGYSVSPILSDKFSKWGLSAGRVQSAALKMLCDKEREIAAFVPEEYWNITADFKEDKKAFTAKLAKFKDKKIDVKNSAQADAIVDDLKNGTFVVASQEEKDRARKPYAPFTTSSLQQDASSKLNFNTRKTMQIAQQLYEGISVKGHGTHGLITYIRTDSTRISEEARSACKAYIIDNFGAEYWKSNIYGNKKKDIQDAHEAIRPSDVTLDPETAKASLTNDQYKLYKLIWSRFVASQMAQASFKDTKIDIANGDYTFAASGSKMVFPGFLKVYQPGKEDDKILPHLENGQVLEATKVDGEQKFTQPPARFTEASLVKELEEKNIGRPSTYATIIGTLADRKYMKREKKLLVPTELGMTVDGWLEQYFTDIVNAEFTASMEDRLDDVESEGAEWKQVMRDFWPGFKKELENAGGGEKVDTPQPTPTESEPLEEPRDCPKCGKALVYKRGKFGKFIACSAFPECDFTETIIVSTGVACPDCGKDIIVKRSRRGKTFYGCSNYPDCKKAYWYEPVQKKCPQCGELLTKRVKSSKLYCANFRNGCNYSE